MYFTIASVSAEVGQIYLSSSVTANSTYACDFANTIECQLGDTAIVLGIRVVDSGGLSATANVTLNVQQSNAPPVMSDVSFTVPELVLTPLTGTQPNTLIGTVAVGGNNQSLTSTYSRVSVSLSLPLSLQLWCYAA